MSVFVLGDRREDGGRQSGRKEGLRGGGGGQGSEGKRLKEGGKRKLRPRGSTLVPKVRQPGASPTGMPYDKPPPLQAQVSPSKSLTVVGAQHAGHVSPWTKEQTRVSVRQTPMGSCQEFESGGSALAEILRARLARTSEVRPYKPKPQRRARSGWHRGGAVAADGPIAVTPDMWAGRPARGPPAPEGTGRHGRHAGPPAAPRSPHDSQP